MKKFVLSILLTAGLILAGHAENLILSSPAVVCMEASGTGTMQDGSTPVVASGITRLPPMGWNSWNAFAKEIDEQLIKDTADAMIQSGLADAGYEYVCIDDGWYLKDESNEGDAVTVNTNRFPGGMASVADYMHQRNLKLGLYTRWISIGHEERDAATWAEWGVDFVKNDAYHTPSTDPYWGKMMTALKATGHPIVHSVHFSDEESNPSNIYEIANMWRVTNDIQDYYRPEDRPKDKQWAYTTLSIADRMAEAAHLIKPGCWADPDMLEIGNGNQTADEYKTQFSLWCLFPAPLIMGHDVRNMKDETLEILTNKEAIAVNQDPAGIPAKRIRKDEETELWSRQLADGSLCVLLLQKTERRRTVSFTWKEVGLKQGTSATIRDLWAHKDLGSHTGHFSIDVNAHGCAMLTVVQ